MVQKRSVINTMTMQFSRSISRLPGQMLPGLVLSPPGGSEPESNTQGQVCSASRAGAAWSAWGRGVASLLGSVSLLLGVACKSEPPKKEPAPATEQTATAALSPAKPAVPEAAPLSIAYSDWPGWVAWDIAIQKHWFDAAGVKVDFKWFEYVPSMEAFSAGKVDACAMTNGDQLVTGASGAPSVAVLINDYSNGNDMVVARAGIDKLEQLKGKKVGVEVGFVSHLLLLNALESAKLTEKDIKIVNVPTDQTAQALKSGSVDAIAAWQPNSGQALREVAGSKAIFTSADRPGIIYDVLAVNPKSLAERRADWEKVVEVWFQVVDYLKDQKNTKDALEIMSGRVSLTPEQYEPLLKGTFLLDAADNLKHYERGSTLASIYHSSEVVDGFNMKNQVYKVSQKPDGYLNPELAAAVVKKRSTAPTAPAVVTK
jgi:NitT/TauT family transport system substrate-binding protein